MGAVRRRRGAGGRGWQDNGHRTEVLSYLGLATSIWQYGLIRGPAWLVWTHGDDEKALAVCEMMMVRVVRGGGLHGAQPRQAAIAARLGTSNDVAAFKVVARGPHCTCSGCLASPLRARRLVHLCPKRRPCERNLPCPLTFGRLGCLQTHSQVSRRMGLAEICDRGSNGRHGRCDVAVVQAKGRTVCLLISAGKDRLLLCYIPHSTISLLQNNLSSPKQSTKPQGLPLHQNPHTHPHSNNTAIMGAVVSCIKSIVRIHLPVASAQRGSC